MGFIQAKKETAWYWANWLAQHHPEIKFQKVVGNIAFTSQYEQATKLHDDRSQGWSLIKAEKRPDFYTQGKGWAFSGSIQVKTTTTTTSPCLDAFNAARASFLDALPENNPPGLHFLSVLCDATSLALSSPENNSTLHVNIMGFLQTNRTTRITAWNTWLPEFSFRPLHGGLNGHPEFTAARAAAELDSDSSSPWVLLHEQGTLRKKGNPSHGVQASKDRH